MDTLLRADFELGEQADALAAADKAVLDAPEEDFSQPIAPIDE